MSLPSYTAIILLLLTTTATAQTVTDFVQLIDTEFPTYREGEFRANDSIVDTGNGYYERSFDFGGGNPQRPLRQVAVFSNGDGTKTIAEAIAYYDFSCWVNQIKFYRYAGGSLHPVDRNAQILPAVPLEKLVSAEALAVFQKYYPGVSREIYPTLADFIGEAYGKRYDLPHYGTEVIVELEFCDYFGWDLEQDISEADWRIIEKGMLPMCIAYDRKRKRFEIVGVGPN